MPIELLYLAVVFAVAIVFFVFLKRPLYECMLVAFIALVAVTGTWSGIGTFIWDALKEPTLYVIFVFIISASLLSKTTVIESFLTSVLQDLQLKTAIKVCQLCLREVMLRGSSI